MADKYRFYAIKAANEEITRLEELVAERDTTLSAAQERIKALESAPATDQLQADLATARQTIKTLEGQVQAKDTEIGVLNAKVQAAEAKATNAEKTVSAKALEIVAAQGVPPVTTPATAAPAADKPKAQEPKLKGYLRVAQGIREEFGSK